MEATYNCVARFDVKVRPTPDTANSTSLQIKAGTAFQISEIVPDRLDPTNTLKKWGHIFGGVYDGKYTALEYPNNSNPISTYTPIVVDPPGDGGGEPPVTPKIIGLTVIPHLEDGTDGDPINFVVEP